MQALPVEATKNRLRIKDQSPLVQDLLKPPAVAWPTLVLFVVAFTLMVGGILAGAFGYWSAGAVFLSTLVGHYLMFTVVHDASHRSLSVKYERLNEWVGNIGGFLLIPLLTCSNFRYLHMQHHRYANAGSEHDPDDWAGGGSNWTLPLRWLTIHARYIYFYFPKLKDRPRKEVLETLVSLGLGFLIAGVATAYGHLDKVFIYYLLPMTISFAFLAMAFDWLPHHPHDVPENENPYKATSIREGANWLLTPLLLSQNYHLIHHLFPRIPFYRYGAAWRGMEDELVSRGARVVSPLGNSIRDL